MDDLVIHYTNPLFSSGGYRNVDLETIDWPRFYKKIFENNVGVLFLKNFERDHPNVEEKVPLFEELAVWIDQEKVRLVRTLKFFKELADENGVEFLIFKSLAPFESVKDDFDVWFPKRAGFLKLRRLLFGLGFTAKRSSLHHLDKQGFAQIDVHPLISWNYLGRSGYSSELIDSDRVWRRRRKISYEGLELPVPSAEDEVLILNLHSIFQHHYLTLGEILFIGELLRAQKIDYDYLFGMAREYSWEKFLRTNLSTIKTFYRQFWGIDLPIPVRFKKRLSPRLFYHLSFFDPPRNYESSLKVVVNYFLTLYRYLYYIKYKKALPFNLPLCEKVLGKKS